MLIIHATSQTSEEVSFISGGGGYRWSLWQSLWSSGGFPGVGMMSECFPWTPMIQWVLVVSIRYGRDNILRCKRSWHSNWGRPGVKEHLSGASVYKPIYQWKVSILPSIDGETRHNLGLASEKMKHFPWWIRKTYVARTGNAREKNHGLPTNWGDGKNKATIAQVVWICVDVSCFLVRWDSSHLITTCGQIQKCPYCNWHPYIFP